MKKRYMALLLAVALVMTMVFTGAALADQNDGGTVTESVYNDTADETTDEDATTGTADEESAVETEGEPSDLEDILPAEDIVPDEIGQEDLPDPLEGSWEDLTELADQVDEEMAGAGPVEKLHALILRLKGTRGWDAAHLVAVSGKIRLAARNHQAYLNTHPKAKRAMVLMTDETVRLAHNKLQNNRAKLVVYNNAVHTYALLGCYKRAAAVAERVLKFSNNRNASYNNLKNLYKKTDAKGLKVFVRGQRPNFDANARPMIQNGRTLVPVRAITEAMGARVGYDEKQQKVMINNGTVDVNLFINNKGAIVNGKRVNLDEPARIVNGRTMVPLRFISENLGANVNWDGETETITVE